MRVTDVLNLREHGGPQFVSLKSYMCASLCRYASKTFRGWQPLLSMLRDSAAEALPTRDVILGVLSPSFRDDPPIVSSFLDAWTHLYTVSLAPRPPTWRQISDIAPLPILDQSVIYQASVEHHFPDDLAGLVVRRLRATFGVSKRLTNSLDLDFFFRDSTSSGGTWQWSGLKPLLMLGARAPGCIPPFSCLVYSVAGTMAALRII